MTKNSYTSTVTKGLTNLPSADSSAPGAEIAGERFLSFNQLNRRSDKVKKWYNFRTDEQSVFKGKACQIANIDTRRQRTKILEFGTRGIYNLAAFDSSAHTKERMNG